MPASANDSFCAQTDVEGLVQRGVFGVSTVPTLQQVLEFMADRSAMVEAVLRDIGHPYTPAAGTHPFAASPSTDLERQLKRLAARAAANGAAADAIMAYAANSSAEVPPRATDLLEQFRMDLRTLATYRDDSTTGLAMVTGTELDPPETTW